MTPTLLPPAPTAEQHLRWLAEFVKGVALAGGTTPHVSMTVSSMAALDDPLEKLWLAGCYALTYNWPAAERIWLEWRPADFRRGAFLRWLDEHHAGIPLRKERKAVFRRPYFAASAESYLAFARRLTRGPWPDTYLGAFTLFTTSCDYMGRYIAIRWLEVMRRAFPAAASWQMPDVRSDGGEHPRKALALLYPADAPALLGGNSRREVAVADAAADRALADLRSGFGLDADYYQLQSLLCEYKQSALGRKQYPGKSIDTELDYFARVYAHWGADRAAGSSFFAVRERCFPAWSRGEVSGWPGVRKELGSALAAHRLTWSDAIFDYPATADLSAPVLRDPAVRSLSDLMAPL